MFSETECLLGDQSRAEAGGTTAGLAPWKSESVVSQETVCLGLELLMPSPTSI